MIDNISQYRQQFKDIIQSGQVLLKNELPSEFAERNITMRQPFPGAFRYNKTPYTREIVDCLAPDHPCRWLAFMKGLQVGASAGVILPGLAWIIANSPANTYFTVGSPDLIDKASEKLDLIIDSAKLRQYIKPSSNRRRNNNTGDKNTKKDFAGGYIVITSANNHRNWRDVSLKYGFFDDCEAFKSSSKEAGSTIKLIEGRFAAYKDVHKIFWISTPELKELSNIEPLYLKGDQRKYLIPCPCCGEFIEIIWEVQIDEKNKAGIHYELDNLGNVVEKSVGYICQKCAGFFKDTNKQKLLNDGFWQPTAKPKILGYYSYHLSSLYAPVGMYDWYRYCIDFNEACPQNQPKKEKLYQTFVNTCLGLTYENTGKELSAVNLQTNVRPYDICIVPEKLSIADGNGKIVLITCGCDMNGKPEDARLDYEIVAWAENGSTYSILEGSCGTFIPNENSREKRDDRQKYSMSLSDQFSVWTEFEKIRTMVFKTDTGKSIKILITGIDVGYKDHLIYAYIDSKVGQNIVALKGEKEDQYFKVDLDVRYFKIGKARPDFYLLPVGFIKDDLADYMQLNWNKKTESYQPFNFMNFPQPSNGLYGYENYFSHYEAEVKKLVDKKDSTQEFRWVKKQANSQNHKFDCRIYNMALKEIWIYKFGKSIGVNKFTWDDYIKLPIFK